MFIERAISKSVMSGSTQSPVIAIIGPRQSGKSTLARTLFKNYTYIDIQDAEIFEFANQDPKGFLYSYKSEYGIILDEVQYAPKLFSQIKVEVDKNPRPGYYILSGSQNFLLYEKISESLAGRVYFYTLLPLSIRELKNANLVSQSPNEQIFKGFYPKVYQPNIDPHEYYKNYIATYIERDIRTIRNIDNNVTFNKFMQLCALYIGTTVNLSRLATECGISINTVKSWLSLLQTSFVLFLLPSYHHNLGKRITKSPKLYFYDVGLAATLLGVNQEIIIAKRNIYGALFENMIIVDVMKYFNAQSKRYNLMFFRDMHQNEVDLIIEYENRTVPVEIKSSQTIDSRFFDTLIWFESHVHTNERPIIVYGGSQIQSRSKGKVIPWNGVESIFIE